MADVITFDRRTPRRAERALLRARLICAGIGAIAGYALFLVLFGFDNETVAALPLWSALMLGGTGGFLGHMFGIVLTCTDALPRTLALLREAMLEPRWA